MEKYIFDTRKKILRTMYHESWVSENQIRRLIEDANDYPIHETLQQMLKNKLIKRKKFGGQWKYNTKDLSEKSFDSIIFDIKKRSENPPVWLYHRASSHNNVEKILKEGLIPKSTISHNCEGDVCKILDDHLPFRKDVAYFHPMESSKPKCGNNADDSWESITAGMQIKVRADEIPCICKDVGYDITNDMYHYLNDKILNKTIDKATKLSLKKVGFDGTWGDWEESTSKSSWMSEIQKKYNKIYDKTFDIEWKKNLVEIQDPENLEDGFYDIKKQWLNNLRPLDTKETDYTTEVMCPCKIPPKALRMYCDE